MQSNKTTDYAIIYFRDMNWGSVIFEDLCAPDQGRHLMPTLAPRGRSCPNVVDDGVHEKDMD